jgi:hypothetical protein
MPRGDNTTDRRIRTSIIQTMIYKTLHRTRVEFEETKGIIRSCKSQ